MAASTTQIQLKLSLSDQLAGLLRTKADQLGLPVTQFVKHLIIKAVETDNIPVYPASDWAERETELAMKEYDKAIEVKDIHAFFKSL